MSEISRNNAQGGGGNEVQERISEAEAAEDTRPSRPLIAGGENEPAPVSLDLQPLPYNSLSDQEKEAFDRFVGAVPDLLRGNELEPSVQQQGREQSSLPFLKNLVTEHPKITRVKKTPIVGDVPSFLLQAATFILVVQAGTADESSTDLFKVLIENNPSACFWAPGPSYPICIKSIVMLAPSILIWLVDTLPCVLERTYELHQTVNGGSDLGLSASYQILEHYFKQSVSKTQVETYFNKYTQGIAESICYDNQQVPLILSIVWKTIQFQFRDEHLMVLKFLASKRPDLLCTGEVSVVLSALCLLSMAVERGDLIKDQACLFIKTLVCACPASVTTKGKILIVDEAEAPRSPFDAIHQPNFPMEEHIRDDLKPFFDLGKKCLDRQAALEVDLSVVQTVLDKVQVIAKIHHSSIQADGRIRKVFGGKKSAYQEWASEFIQKSRQAHEDVFVPLSCTEESSENLLSGSKRRRV